MSTTLTPNAAMSGEPKTSPLMAQLCNKRRDAMAKKMCEICGENPATAPVPGANICAACHALRLVGDMKRILELHEKRRQAQLGHNMK